MKTPDDQSRTAPVTASGCATMRRGAGLSGHGWTLTLLCLLPAGAVASPDAAELQAQIERQRAENQALKAKIDQFEQVLKTDVCNNPEAAKLLEAEAKAEPPEPAKTE